MSKYRKELDAIKHNLNYLQLTTLTLNDLIKSITGTSDSSLFNNLNLEITDHLTSKNYLTNRFLEIDKTSILIDKLFTTIKDGINVILNLETILIKLESTNPHNELTHSQIVSNLKYIISILSQDYALKTSLAKVVKLTKNDDELQRIRILWLDSPVSESHDKNLYTARLDALNALLNA